MPAPNYSHVTCWIPAAGKEAAFHIFSKIPNMAKGAKISVQVL